MEIGFPPVGTTWVHRAIKNDGSVSTVTWIVLPDEIYRGKPAHRSSNGIDRELWDAATLDCVAVYFNDFARGASIAPIEDLWEVRACEHVTVAAGTFKAFRLQSSPGRNSGRRLTYWYAPATNQHVKAVRKRTGGHFLGEHEVRIELVEFRLP